MKNWVEKYRPTTAKDIVGQGKGIELLEQAIKEKKAVLVHGAVGVGKTCSVYSLAEDMNCELIELNASDLRDAESVQTIVGGSLQQQSLFGKGKVILVDEVEGIAGREDRGGLLALQKLLEFKNYPVIFVANNPWDKKFNTLRKKCVLIDFRKLNYLSIAKILRTICEQENIEYDDEALKTIARRSDGDARSAINDLQTYAAGYNKLGMEQILEVGEREKETNIFDAIRIVLKSKNAEHVLGVFDRVNCTLDEAFLWVEENVPREYKRPEDLERAFNMLSLADLFKGRIRRWQYWRFLVYVIAFMSVGVAVSKEEKYSGFTPYQRTQRLLKIWMTNQKNFRRKELAAELAPKLHCSSRRFIKDYVPYLKIMAKKKKLPALDITDEQREWLQK